jgi:transposase
VPEVRRLLLAIAEPPERFRFRLAWSTFRRHHQAVAKHCHSRRRAQQQPVQPRTPRIERLVALDWTLTEERWQRIVALLPPRKPRTGRPNNDHRMILSAMLWVMRTGASWRELPAAFGPWGTIHSRYWRWRNAGIWQQILQVFQDPGTTLPY